MINFLKENKEKLLLFAIFCLGFFLRIHGINWDQGQHLHPDERFLTMVGNIMHVPRYFLDYFDPAISTLNPANIGYRFFVYGSFPVIFNKTIAILLSNDTYNAFTLQGRLLSAILDSIIIFLVYKNVELLQRKYTLHKSIKLYASFFYALSVLPIQLSHFFTVDIFLNFFMFMSWYFLLRSSIKKTWINVIYSAIFFGLAVSSKISAIYILPLNIFFLAYIELSNKKDLLTAIYAKQVLVHLFVYAVLAYISLRIFNPYLFEDNSFFNFHISSLFYENIKTLKSFEGSQTWFPPAIQWISKTPIVFSLYNFAYWGIGIFSFFFLVYGIFTIFKNRYWLLAVTTCWTILFFTYQSLQFVQTMRYFIFLYPFFAIFSGIGFYQLIHNRPNLYKYIILLLMLAYPLSFLDIYNKPHTRVIASEWIYNNLPNNSNILGEYWDDILPLPINNSEKKFNVDALHVFDQDTPEKWDTMEKLLDKNDYLILSSNRGWGSILPIPNKYPKMSKFYADLFTGKLHYKKIKEFSSYPSLRYLEIPIDFNDENADEAFTVYDHPKVIIFQNIRK